jgi:putative toxin-antitoxin system antitoxin component (TIGR02293 family)
MPSKPVPPKEAVAPSSNPSLPPVDELLTQLKGELSVKDLWRIASRIGMSAEQFEKITDASPHRLRRGRGGEEKVDVAKNEAIARCTRVFKRVLALCNRDEGAARGWLNAPAPILKNQKPIESAETSAGAKEVEALVGQLEKAAGLSK